MNEGPCGPTKRPGF